MSEKVLTAVANRLEKKLRKQSQKALAEVFTETGCKAVGREIKAGRNVTGNAEFGIRVCVHPKIGPRYDPTTGKFTPMSARGKHLLEQFVSKTNYLLETGGFRRMSPNLIPNLRKKDRAFKKEVRRRRR